MFVDKSTPTTVTVARVSRFFSAPGVKNSDTVATVYSSAPYVEPKPQIHGYLLCMETATGTWYYSGFSGENTRLAWTQDEQRCKVFPGRERNQQWADKAQAEITDLFGAGAIIGKITAKPVSIVNHRNILIEEEEQ